MLRFTELQKDGTYRIMTNTDLNQENNEYYNDAINKLAKFENLYDDLLKKQTKISIEMEKLRMEGKTQTATFKHLLVNKLTNNNIIGLFESYGLK